MVLHGPWVGEKKKCLTRDYVITYMPSHARDSKLASPVCFVSRKKRTTNFSSRHYSFSHIIYNAPLYYLQACNLQLEIVVPFSLVYVCTFYVIFTQLVNISLIITHFGGPEKVNVTQKECCCEKLAFRECRYFGLGWNYTALNYYIDSMKNNDFIPWIKWMMPNKYIGCWLIKWRLLKNWYPFQLLSCAARLDFSSFRFILPNNQLM